MICLFMFDDARSATSFDNDDMTISEGYVYVYIYVCGSCVLVLFSNDGRSIFYYFGDGRID